MNADQFIAARVSSELKTRLRAFAEQQHLSESVLLKQLLEAALQSESSGQPVRTLGPVRRGPRVARLMIRIRSEDEILLRERAASRGMASATYASVLLRAHLRALPPLPKEELLLVKRSVSELAHIGRNLNQMALAANRGEWAGPGQQEMKAMLRICVGLRDHIKALLIANVRSWEQGHVDQGK